MRKVKIRTDPCSPFSSLWYRVVRVSDEACVAFEAIYVRKDPHTKRANQ